MRTPILLMIYAILFYILKKPHRNIFALVLWSNFVRNSHSAKIVSCGLLIALLQSRYYPFDPLPPPVLKFPQKVALRLGVYHAYLKKLCCSAIRRCPVIGFVGMVY